MKIELHELNDWVERCDQVNGILLQLAVQPSSGLALVAQQRVNGLRQAIVRAGGEDPVPATTEIAERQAYAAQFAPPETPIALLGSPANRRYVEALRTAVAAAQEVDRERGCLGDGPAEILEDMLKAAEFEVLGPVGLRE